MPESFSAMYACCPLLPEQRERDDGQFRVGTSLQDGCGRRGRDVDIARDQQLEVLPAAGVPYLDVKVLLGEVSLFLRHVCGDERQVGLRLEAGHEDNLVEGFIYIVVTTRDGKDNRGEHRQEENASHAPNSTRLYSP